MFLLQSIPALESSSRFFETVGALCGMIVTVYCVVLYFKLKKQERVNGALQLELKQKTEELQKADDKLESL